MAGVLLDAWGELSYFDCETCTDDDKRTLGCGTAPVVTAPDDLQMYHEGKGRYRFWTYGLWHEVSDIMQAPATEETATLLYEFANHGEVMQATGTPWRCCPAWYSRMSPMGSVDAVKHARRLLGWREAGALSSVKSSALQQWEIDLVEVASRLFNAKEHRDIERRAAQAKATASAQGRGRG